MSQGRWAATVPITLQSLGAKGSRNPSFCLLDRRYWGGYSTDSFTNGDSPMTRETLERMARDLAAEITLPAEDWDAIVTQAASMLGWINALDELPLQNVEPASMAPLTPPREGKP